jgi:hypothetical protein
MLHPHYMHVLYPDPEVAKAVDVTETYDSAAS